MTLVLAAVVLAVAPADAPARFSYVYSDSMEPTIGEDGGYVLVPAGDVEPGEVVSFWSAERDGYVTHRVVGASERGFITRGDNNDQTDQAGGHPYVQREQIVGEVATLYGRPVVIPGFGVGVEFVRTNSGVLALAAVVVLAGYWRGKSGAAGRPTRSVTTTRQLLAVVFLAGLLSTTGAFVLGGAVQDDTFVAVDGRASGPSTVAVGEPHQVAYVVSAPAGQFTHRVVGGAGLRVRNVTANRSAMRVSAVVPPPDASGPVRTTLTVHRYPATLPATVLSGLTALHPAVAAVASALSLLGPLWLVAAAALDGRTPLRTPRWRWLRRLEGERP